MRKLVFCCFLLFFGLYSCATANNQPISEQTPGESQVSSEAVTPDGGAGNDITESTAELISDGSSEATAQEERPLDEPTKTTVKLKGNFLDFLTAKGVPDVQVCPLDSKDLTGCTKTDSNGVLDMMVPANALVSLQTQREGYQNAIMVFRTTSVDFSFPEFVIGSPSLVDKLFAGATVTWDRKWGAVAVHVDISGVTPSLRPASGGEPFYIVNGKASRSKTGSPGPGLVLFANVESAEVELTLTHQTKNCTHPTLSSTPTTVVTVPIRADHFTSLFDATCK